MRYLLLILSLIVPTRALGCDVALVLALDVSGSVDRDEYRIQMDGLTAALGDPVVSEAMVNAKASVTVVQWSGNTRQAVSVPWMRIESHDDVARLRGAVQASERFYRNYSTAIGEVLDFSVNLFSDLPRPCRRRVIDVSGDGANNEGMDPLSVRVLLRAANVTVNGLAIEGSEPDMTGYYRENVMYGPGAFVETAEGFDDFPRAIRRKLLNELAQRLSMR